MQMLLVRNYSHVDEVISVRNAEPMRNLLEITSYRWKIDISVPLLYGSEDFHLWTFGVHMKCRI